MISHNTIHAQWSTRPGDQRFLSLPDLHAFCEYKRKASIQEGIALDHARLSSDNSELYIASPHVQESRLTHWAFGQLCQRAGAPAAYLRALPAPLAAIPLQWSLEHADSVDARLLTRTDSNLVNAITSDSYGRIWDSQVSGALMEHLDLERWKIPSASYASTDPKRASTLYASDRDMFVCLVDQSTPIEIPGAPEDTLFRGLIVRNSEVGAATLEITCFHYRKICDNRLIHGLGEQRSLKIKHTSGAPDRMLREAQPAIRAFADSATSDTVRAVIEAKERYVDDPMAWLRARGFTKREATVGAGLQNESKPHVMSAWDIVQNLTADAHTKIHNDDRFDLERRASALLG